MPFEKIAEMCLITCTVLQQHTEVVPQEEVRLLVSQLPPEAREVLLQIRVHINSRNSGSTFAPTMQKCVIKVKSTHC